MNARDNSTPKVITKICLIEDDEIMGEALADRFALEKISCDWFKTGSTGLAALAEKSYGLVICDIHLPDLDGEQLFIRAKESLETLPPFIFVTGFASTDRAVRLVKLGALEYLTKPLDVRDLISRVKHIAGAKHSKSRRGESDQLGISGEMRQIEAMLPKLSRHHGSVLITGESGVGKDEVAKRLHQLKFPNGEPFVGVNCGALTESLMEAELFGYVKGAFTGAVRDKKGYFEQAHGGTLFLDEIGEMLPSMQVKLLRAIQNQQIQPLGTEEVRSVNISLVCATNRNLRQMVIDGKFREDLYYRINVVHIHVPPLRQRQDDILWLAQYFLGQWQAQGQEAKELSSSAVAALLRHPWSGNVRELKHCLERACILSEGSVLTDKALFSEHEPIRESASEPNDDQLLVDYLHECERTFIERRLRANAWRISETAASLGISRKNLWEKMKKLQIADNVVDTVC